MELYIIRHAQSTNNALMEDPARRVQDPDLTDVGYQQAEHVAHFLATATNLEQIVRHPADSSRRTEPHNHDLTHLYCSPMRRALQTALPISKALNMQPHVWVDIHEHGGIWLEVDGVHQGFGGMTRSQIETEFPGYVLPDSITEDGWYNIQQAQEDYTLALARAVRVAGQLRERATAEATSQDKVAIIAHGTFIDVLLKALLNRLPGSDYFHWHYNTGITRLDFMDDGRLLIRYVNRVTHLPPELVT